MDNISPRPGRGPGRLDGVLAARLARLHARPGFGLRVKSLASLRWRLCQCRLVGFTQIQGVRVAAAAAGPDHLPHPGSLSRGHLLANGHVRASLASPPSGQARRQIRSLDS